MQLTPVIELCKNYYSGIAISVVIAIAAGALASHYDAPVMLFALLMGLGLHFLYESPTHQRGIDFCSRTLLRFAVALLGVRIAFADVVSLGVTAPLIIISGMVFTMIFGVMLARGLGLSRASGVLSSGSVAVCGVSAAAAIATVLPKKAVEENMFALVVVTVTTVGTVAMVLYPVLVTFIGLPNDLAGVFIGGSIHDVAQVVAAGYSISPETGDIATYIKLLRVTLLLPIVMIIYVVFKERDSQMQGSIASYVPAFLIGFFVLALLNNLGVIPAAIVELCKQVSSWCLVVSIAAIGAKTSLKQIASVGWKPVILLTTQSLFFAVFIAIGIALFML
ncbi:YeiH family protein [Thalassotalea maritima]|uniref:YeiH family protein n=1 Tax=Thalassotalea maritima TaxID=3242416 RepID=UPI0035274957